MNEDISSDMDKIAANNHFVDMMKEVKNAKAMVAGNLMRKMKNLKADLETNDDLTKSKITNKVDQLYEDSKRLKHIDNYVIAKRATLQSDKGYWSKVLSDSKSSSQDRLTARIILKNNIQRRISQFKNENKDCDEWLEEYIEYREKKKDLQFTKSVKHKGKRKSKSSKKTESDNINCSPKQNASEDKMDDR